ncbi:MAG: ABC transporter ATP-binding protein [Planctomycetota bacterium]|nr:ABC transporter ATP-binding protein [Planctomycetota bacterium]
MIRLVGFTKKYGNGYAVKDLTLKIGKGEVFGFVGPNGAGKTTTIRFLATLLKPTWGEGWVAGRSVLRDPVGVRRAIGYMPDRFGVYEGMRVWEYLDFFALAYGIPYKQRKAVIRDVLELVDLSPMANTPAQDLSLGVRQRLCLAKTLVHDPPVLLLDEPASGLDPRARIEIRELLKELRRMGKTILISSHILSELAQICTTIGVIERGDLIAAGSVEDILKEVRERRLIQIDVLSGSNEAERVLNSHSAVSQLERVEGTFRFEFAGDLDEVVKLQDELGDAGARILWAKEVEADLEEAFLKITKGIVS